MLKKIILASPRGFCAGVTVAIETVERLAKKYPKETIYVRHEIVHNKHVVNRLKEEYGVVFVESLSEVPLGSRVILSAHGVPPKVYEQAKLRNLKVTDATCMLVEKVHSRAKKYAEDKCNIILIGHAGHQEVIGTMGYAKMLLVEKLEDVDKLDIDKNSKVAYITQTTLSKHETKKIEETLVKKFPGLETSHDDICYATTNRQNAIIALAKKVDSFFIIGEKNSSNSKRLVETAKKQGINAYLISTYEGITPKLLEGIENLGITAGASAPEIIVQEVIEYLKKGYGGEIEEYVHVEEKAKFPSKDLS